MEIYADPITVNCRKVLAGLHLLGADYSLSKVDYFAGEQKGDAYKAINPNAALPALKDGDFVLWESNAILQYAADKTGKTEFNPSDPVGRADVNRWLLWEAASWFPSCYVYLVENCVKPLLGDTPDPAVLAGEADNFHKLAGILNDRLGEGAWLCGDGVTIADIAVAATHAPPRMGATAAGRAPEPGPLDDRACRTVAVLEGNPCGCRIHGRRSGLMQDRKPSR